MITSPKVIATPTCPSEWVLASTITAPAPANTSANVPNASATSTLASGARCTSTAARVWLCRHERKRCVVRLRLGRLDDRRVHPVRHFVREGDGDVLEPCASQAAFVLALRQRSGDAADVAAALHSL